jgi:hypothetical protein
MPNPFLVYRPGALSNSTLAQSLLEYRRMLFQLGLFSDSTAMRVLRVQVQAALAELETEAEQR